MDTPDKVVSLLERLAEPPPIDLAPPKPYARCGHTHTVLDEHFRSVACRDCGEEALDPFDVLVGLARTWRRWKSEAEALRRLRTEQRTHEAEKWRRARDRHLGAHPAHGANFPLDGLPDQHHLPRDCRICYSLAVRYRP